MRRGSGLGEKFAREKFTTYKNDFITPDEAEHLEAVHGGAFCGLYPQSGWEKHVGFKPDGEDYLELRVLIYPEGEPFDLARFLIPRDENVDEAYMLWNHYKGETIFKKI